MIKSTRDITKNIRQPRAPARGTAVLTRFQPDDLAALDAYRSANEPMTRPQAIRAALSDWLRTHGFGPPKHPKPTGPATDAVEAMEKAIRKDRKSKTKKN